LLRCTMRARGTVRFFVRVAAQGVSVTPPPPVSPSWLLPLAV
jgi:hypothetical protein